MLVFDDTPSANQTKTPCSNLPMRFSTSRAPTSVRQYASRVSPPSAGRGAVNQRTAAAVSFFEKSDCLVEHERDSDDTFRFRWAEPSFRFPPRQCPRRNSGGLGNGGFAQSATRGQCAKRPVRQARVDLADDGVGAGLARAGCIQSHDNGLLALPPKWQPPACQLANDAAAYSSAMR